MKKINPDNINFYATEKRIKEKVKSKDFKDSVKFLAPILIILLIIVPLIAYLVSLTLPSEDSEQKKIDETFSKEADDYAIKYPIVEILPYIGEGFRIDYGLCENSDNDFCLRVSALSKTLPSAIDFLISLDSYKIEDYSVEFPDFKCPFEASSIDPSSLDFKPLEGNYYGALLSFKNYEDTEMFYRVLAEKTDTSYKIIESPKLFFSFSDFKDIKPTVIEKLNRL